MYRIKDFEIKSEADIFEDKQPGGGNGTADYHEHTKEEKQILYEYGIKRICGIMGWDPNDKRQLKRAHLYHRIWCSTPRPFFGKGKEKYIMSVGRREYKDTNKNWGRTPVLDYIPQSFDREILCHSWRCGRTLHDEIRKLELGAREKGWNGDDPFYVAVLPEDFEDNPGSIIFDIESYGKRRSKSSYYKNLPEKDGYVCRKSYKMGFLERDGYLYLPSKGKEPYNPSVSVGPRYFVNEWQKGKVSLTEPDKGFTNKIQGCLESDYNNGLLSIQVEGTDLETQYDKGDFVIFKHEPLPPHFQTIPRVYSFKVPENTIDQYHTKEEDLLIVKRCFGIDLFPYFDRQSWRDNKWRQTLLTYVQKKENIKPEEGMTERVMELWKDIFALLENMNIFEEVWSSMNEAVFFNPWLVEIKSKNINWKI